MILFRSKIEKLAAEGDWWSLHEALEGITNPAKYLATAELLLSMGCDCDWGAEVFRRAFSLVGSRDAQIASQANKLVLQVVSEHFAGLTEEDRRDVVSLGESALDAVLAAIKGDSEPEARKSAIETAVAIGGDSVYQFLHECFRGWPWQEDYDNADASVILAALDAIESKWGGDTIPALLCALAMADHFWGESTVHERAEQLLRKHGQAKLVGALKEALKGDPRQAERLKDDRIADALIATLRTTRTSFHYGPEDYGDSEAVFCNAASALAHIARNYAFSVLSEDLMHNNPTRRCNAALALGKLGDQRAIEVLEPLLYDRSKGALVWDLCDCAQWALGQMQADSGIDALLRRLSSGGGGLLETVEALGKSRNPKAIEPLRRYFLEIRDPDGEYFGVIDDTATVLFAYFQCGGPFEPLTQTLDELIRVVKTLAFVGDRQSSNLHVALPVLRIEYSSSLADLRARYDVLKSTTDAPLLTPSLEGAEIDAFSILGDFSHLESLLDYRDTRVAAAQQEDTSHGGTTIWQSIGDKVDAIDRMESLAAQAPAGRLAAADSHSDAAHTPPLDVTQEEIETTDIHFVCQECGKHLAIDQRAAGMTIECVDCGTALAVPRAGVNSGSTCAEDAI